MSDQKSTSDPVTAESAKDKGKGKEIEPVTTEVEKKPVVVDVKETDKSKEDVKTTVVANEETPEGEAAEDTSASEEHAPVIDMDTFGQILEMDDDDEHEFSKSIVENYFEQAATTFVDMDKALAAKDLPELSRLGHFLKGSSAALGITQVQTGCEAMQHYGALKDGANGRKLSPEEALALIRPLLLNIKDGHNKAEKWLKKYYGGAKA